MKNPQTCFLKTRGPGDIPVTQSQVNTIKPTGMIRPSTTRNIIRRKSKKKTESLMKHIEHLREQEEKEKSSLGGPEMEKGE